MREAVERGSKARIIGGRGDARADRDEEFELLGHWRQRRCCDEGFLAGDAGRNQHAGIAEAVGCDGDLLEIGGIGVDVARSAVPREGATEVGMNQRKSIGLPDDMRVLRYSLRHQDGPGCQTKTRCRTSSSHYLDIVYIISR